LKERGTHEPNCIILQFDQAITNFITEKENKNDRDKFNSSLPLLAHRIQATSWRAKEIEGHVHGLLRELIMSYNPLERLEMGYEHTSPP
jgi:hypothetical protein